MGSVAMDRQGNISLGYSVSNGTDVYPGIRYTGRLAGDPAGEMTLGEGVIVNGSGVQTTTNSRWGDYTSMNVDPVDDCTFWYVNEYYEVSGLPLPLPPLRRPGRRRQQTHEFNAGPGQLAPSHRAPSLQVAAQSRAQAISHRSPCAFSAKSRAADYLMDRCKPEGGSQRGTNIVRLRLPLSNGPEQNAEYCFA
jgi:hypothetical protein